MPVRPFDQAFWSKLLSYHFTNIQVKFEKVKNIEITSNQTKGTIKSHNPKDKTLT